jgi:hypothetical protein
MGKTIRPGQVYEIADPPHGFYYGVIATGGDVVFLNTTSPTPAFNIEAIDVTSEVLRIPVNHPSIRRAGWRIVGETPIEGHLAEYALYLYAEPESGVAQVYDNKAASVHSAPEAAVAHLEVLAVWDAANHVPKLLRQHFYGEPTALARRIRSPRFRK